MFQFVDHLELIVANLAASVAFYETCGLELVHETDHHGKSVEMVIPGEEFVLEMHEPELEEYIGINHVAFFVSDMDAAVATLVEAGAVLERGPLVFKQTGRTLANLRDPDGWRLQVVSGRDQTNQGKSDGPPKGVVAAFDHIDFYTADLGRYSKFYRTLGLKLVAEIEHGSLPTAQFELLGEKKSMIDVHQVGQNRVVGINHLGFRCDDVQAAHRHFEASKYSVDYAPKLVESTGRTLFTVRDPNGLRVQFSDTAN